MPKTQVPYPHRHSRWFLVPTTFVVGTTAKAYKECSPINLTEEQVLLFSSVCLTGSTPPVRSTVYMPVRYDDQRPDRLWVYRLLL